MAENWLVVGNSAGGNLAAAVSLMAKENNPNLKFQLLFWPVTNADFETESYNKFATLKCFNQKYDEMVLG